MKNTLRLLPMLLTLGCASSGLLFDDFSYAKKEDLAANGWILRTAPGWPGVPGALWEPESFSLHDGILRMAATTDGTVTRQSQLCHARKYLEGTYAARVRFSDAPVAGPGGDQVVQTFYLISPLKAPMDLDYSETDFEYLPNGGWGKQGARFYATTWETFHPEPEWKADNVFTDREGSFAGWKNLVIQITQGKVRYFVNGEPFAVADGKVYPEVPMSINFNLWFIRDGLLPPGALRQWEEDIDWVFFDRAILAPAAVDAKIAKLRARGVKFRDTVRPIGLPSPCNF